MSKVYLITYTMKRSGDNSNINTPFLVKQYYRKIYDEKKQSLECMNDPDNYASALPIDLGDDPSILGYYMFKDCGGRLTWGVCNGEIREKIKKDDFVVFFALDKSIPTFWTYYFVGFAKVEEKITQVELLTCNKYKHESYYANKLIQIRTIGCIFIESCSGCKAKCIIPYYKGACPANPSYIFQSEEWANDKNHDVYPEKSWHHDWIWRIVNRKEGLKKSDLYEGDNIPLSSDENFINYNTHAVNIKHDKNNKLKITLENGLKKVNPVLGKNYVIFYKNSTHILKRAIPVAAKFKDYSTETWFNNIPSGGLKHPNTIKGLTIEKLTNQHLCHGGRHPVTSFEYKNNWYDKMKQLVEKLNKNEVVGKYF